MEYALKTPSQLIPEIYDFLDDDPDAVNSVAHSDRSFIPDELTIIFRGHGWDIKEYFRTVHTDAHILAYDEEHRLIVIYKAHPLKVSFKDITGARKLGKMERATHAIIVTDNPLDKRVENFAHKCQFMIINKDDIGLLREKIITTQ